MPSDLLQTLASARRSLLSLVEGISQVDAVRQPEDGEWSIIEVLAHMVDVDRYYLAEALAMRDEDDHLFAYFDDEAWKREHPDIRQTPLPDVLQALNDSHAEVLRTFAGLSEADLARPGRHPRGIPYSVRNVLLRFPDHDRNHEQQIASLQALFAATRSD